MNRTILTFFLAVALIFFQGPVIGQDLKLTQTNETGIYKKDQKVAVYAFPDNHADTLHITVYKNNIKILQKKDIKSEKDSILIFEGSFSESCSVIVEVSTNKESGSLGMLIAPEFIQPGVKAPGDFDSYWVNLKKSLAAIPLTVKTAAVENVDIEKGYSCVNVEITCLGPKPARGYFAKPDKASPKSLPIVLLVHAAGVKGSWCRSEPGNAMIYARMGTLCFDLNAHGMMNGQPESYYAGLETGELNTYWLQGLTNRNEVYFRGMYLRLLRTIDFLTSQPEWDCKRILVIGESQGGGQALVAAGLDNRVSAVVAIVPAMCDWFGGISGRMGGWPQPFESGASRDSMLKSLPYFDAANILRNSKAIIFTEIGLIDMVCPSTSVYAALNQAKSKKIIYTVPYRPHHQPQGDLGRKWEETVYKPRAQFISNYLK